MPEGPEIKYVSKLIKNIVLDQTLLKFNILNGPYLTSSSKIYRSQREKICSSGMLNGLVCIDVYSKGKNLFFVFENCMYLVVHAGMAGSWTFCKNKHVLFHMEFENEDLYFQDSRRFSRLYVLNNEQINDFEMKIGPDIFDIDFETFKKQLLRMKKSQLCLALLNQNKISGIGNYLRADIMYVAKLSPYRLVSSLTEEDLCNLYESCRDVVYESYSCKATTCGNYENTIHYGDYTTKVYGKNISENGEQVEKFKDRNKRTVWWVPSIQI